MVRSVGSGPVQTRTIEATQASSALAQVPAARERVHVPASAQQRALVASYKIFAMHMPLAIIAAGLSTLAMSRALGAGIQNPFVLGAITAIPQPFLDAFGERMAEQLGPNFTQPKSKKRMYSLDELKAKLGSATLEGAAFILTFLVFNAVEKAVLGQNTTTNTALTKWMKDNTITVAGQQSTIASLRALYKALACVQVAAMSSTGIVMKPWNPLKNKDAIAVAKGMNPMNLWPSRFKKADKKTQEAMIDFALRGFVVLPVSTSGWPALMSTTVKSVNYMSARASNTIGGGLVRMVRPFGLDAIMYGMGKVGAPAQTGRVQELPDDAPHAHGDSIPLRESIAPLSTVVVERDPAPRSQASSPSHSTPPSPSTPSVVQAPVLPETQTPDLPRPPEAAKLRTSVEGERALQRKRSIEPEATGKEGKQVGDTGSTKSLVAPELDPADLPLPRSRPESPTAAPKDVTKESPKTERRKE